tara:strand:+ start:467 stop:901 length:435 start_codon:yes stop_codon:yes gene_type:complete
MRKTFFQIEDGPIFEGYTDGSKWNGFDNPYFDFQTAKTVLAYYQNQPCKESSEQWKGWDFRPSKTINGKELYFFGGGYIWQELEALDLLTDLLDKWCEMKGVEKASADELLNSSDIKENSYKFSWLEGFINLWNTEEEWSNFDD